MKKMIQTLLPFIISSQLFAIAGFGLNLNQAMFSIDAKTNSTGTGYGYDAISGGIGLGGYLYIDAIPFIDLDLEFSGFGTSYDYLLIINGNSTTYSLPYGSLAGYLTLQKKVFKFSIPVLAKTKLTVGAGLNNQWYKSIPNQSDLNALGITSSTSTLPSENELIEYIKDNIDSAIGFHIQTGLQFKILMLDSFLYYRHVFADNVIPSAKGFGSLNLRLGMGF